MHISVKRLAAGAVAAFLAVTVAACGGGGSRDDSGTDTDRIPGPITSTVQVPQPQPQPQPQPDPGDSTYITYQGFDYNCQQALDLSSDCGAFQQQFFDEVGGNLPAFSNEPANADLDLSFQDMNYAAVTACGENSYDEFAARLVLDGEDNYDGVPAARLYQLYQLSVWYFCDNDSIVENNT